MNLILLQVAPEVELSMWDKFVGLFNLDNFIDSLLLMGIGMTTVFAVLMLIIFLGGLLIKTVNKFFPEEAKPVANVAQAATAVDQNIQEAINKAILAISGGKKQAQKIEKI